VSTASVTRSPDGLIRIEPAAGSIPGGERVLLTFTVVLTVGGLALAGIVPLQLVAMAAACCASAELAIWLQRGVQRRRPAAEVRPLREPGLLRRHR
jgi:hypothetical protein